MEAITLETIDEEPKKLEELRPIETLKKIEAPKNEFHSITLISVEKEKSISRQEFMLQKKEEVGSQLIHYTKIKNRWARADVSIKIIGTTVVVISSILSAVFSAGIASPIVAAILSGIAAVQIGLTEGIRISFTSKHKKFYSNKCAIIQEYSNKLYLLYEKYREDNVITLEEMEQFYRLINEYNAAVKFNKRPITISTGTKKIEPLNI